MFFNKLTPEEILERLQICAETVYNTLGAGYSAELYENALEIEFVHSKLNFKKVENVPIFYRGTKIGSRGGYYYIIDQQVLLEIKVWSAIREEDKRQFRNLFDGLQYLIGILYNYGLKELSSEKVHRPL